MRTRPTTTLVGLALAGSLAVVVLARRDHEETAIETASADDSASPSSERPARKLLRTLPRRIPTFTPAEPPPRFTSAAPPAPAVMSKLEAFDAEARDASWAGDMENAIARRFDPGLVPAWLAGMNLETMECHAHSCRMVVSYPANLTTLATDHPGAETPLDHLARETGPVAGSTEVVSTESASESDGTPTVRVTAVLAFDPAQATPDWVSRQAR